MPLGAVTRSMTSRSTGPRWPKSARAATRAAIVAAVPGPSTVVCPVATAAISCTTAAAVPPWAGRGGVGRHGCGDRRVLLVAVHRLVRLRAAAEVLPVLGELTTEVLQRGQVRRGQRRHRRGSEEPGVPRAGQPDRRRPGGDDRADVLGDLHDLLADRSNLLRHDAEAGSGSRHCTNPQRRTVPFVPFAPTPYETRSDTATNAV